MSSSRLVVKGLPKYVDTKRLREHFAAFAGVEVTDAKVITKNGDSRRFGFVGFKSSKDAARARKYFDQTFVDTCRVSVETAMPVGDAAIPRPWSKHSKGSSAYGRLNEDDEEGAPSGKQTAREAQKKVAERKEQARGKHKKSDGTDKKWEEFLNVANPRSKSTLWSNDTGGKAVAEEVANKKPGGEGMTVKRTRVKFNQESASEGEDEDQGDSTDDDEYDVVKSDAPVERTPVVEDDDAYLKSKMTDDFSDSDDESEEEKEEEKEEEDGDGVSGEEDEQEESSEEDEEEKAKKAKKKSTAKKVRSLLDEDEDEEEDEKKKKSKSARRDEAEVEDIAESGRLFIRNLSYGVTEGEIAQHFGKLGPIAEVHLPIDSVSKKSKGLAYILFMMPAHAVAAQTKLDGTIFQGRLMHVLPAKPQKQTLSQNSNKGPSGFKAEKEQERKATANSEHNWNSLFLNQDAVVASMQESHGLSKAEVLDPESSNMAVRVALGETHAIASTKSFLEENGVNVTAFTEDGAKKKPRSATVIMVKNLPADTDESELRQLFGKHGSLNCLVLAPSRALALAEFLEPSEARAAFRALAYTRFKHTPLYLEWAPATAMKDKGAEKEEKAAEKEEKAAEKGAVAEEAAEEVPDDGSETSTLYVTNLSFDTKEATLLKAVGKKVKGVRAVTIATRPNPKGGDAQSRGFGFLEFGSREEAGSALLQLQGAEIDGHNIKLKMSTRANASTPGAAKKKKKETAASQSGGRKSETKVIVRNMPFEANKKEVQALFHTFGQVRSVRVPRKFDGSHRGFAFVDFLSKEEAKNAVQSLEGTHLYGRHLVIEFADVDESIELIRNKAKRDLDNETKHEGKPAKKSRKSESKNPID